MEIDGVLGRVIYDHESGVLSWSSGCRKGRPIGHVSAKGYLQWTVGSKSFKVHRVIWRIVTGKWPELQIDHIDGDKLNNRFVNLREVSNQHNCQNRARPRANNKTGYYGVYWNGSSYVAAIWANGAMRYLGSFDEPDKAHGVYMAAKRELHEGFVG